MTCYIADHRKTRCVFNKREVQLKHSIRHCFGRDKIIKAAEKLRDAKLKIFKSDFSRSSILPASSWCPDLEAQNWQSMPVDEIIELYQRKEHEGGGNRNHKQRCQIV